MLVKLAADQRTLKAIFGKELKATKKRELLPFYLPWVSGVLEQGKGAQDDIVMTVMLWRLDVGDIGGAMDIARYAFKYGLTMPGKHRRPPQYMFTEEVALAAMRAHAAGEPVVISQLLDTLALTAAADMPDEVRAKLHKITGGCCGITNSPPTRWPTSNARCSSIVRQASKKTLNGLSES